MANQQQSGAFLPAMPETNPVGRPGAKPRARAEAALAAFLFLLNGLLGYRLLRFEYIDQLPSIEGMFLGLARYIQQHWPLYDWFPMWLDGLPSANVYQPLLHYTVAATASIFNTSPASAYHIVTLTTYSLGGVAMYFLARALSGSAGTGFAAAMLFSLFSPSLLLLRDARVDAAGLWNARRLQAMVVYGEGPNVAGLTLCMLALALLHVALSCRRAAWGVAAAVALAAVPATSWPATMALLFGLICYVLAMRWEGVREHMPRMVLLGLIAAALALPFALPSTIWTTFANANVMSDGPTREAARWMLSGLLLAGLALLRVAMWRVPFALRFALLYSLLVGGLVMTEAWFGVRMIPYPFRFHLAWEIGMVLALALTLHLVCAKWPILQLPVTALLLLFWGTQLMHYRQYARHIIRPVEITGTLEYQTARWIDQNLRGERVAAAGTVAFWMNAFTDTPQISGCCLQSITNSQTLTASHIVRAGYNSDAESAEYSLLWMKALAVHAVAIGGPNSRDPYKDFEFPGRFRGRLPLLWQQGDDYIYRVPARVPGLARVVRSSDLAINPPVNGIDVAELRPFVAALDEPGLPIVETAWNGPNEATATGALEPDHVISVAINYDRGWRATANGQDVPLRKDGLGLLVIEPGCSGRCEIVLRWSPGWEPGIAIALALAALAGGLVWIWRQKRSREEIDKLVWGVK